PAHSVRNCRGGRPCDRARKCTHEIRETHEKNLRPSACICGEKNPSLNSTCARRRTTQAHRPPRKDKMKEKPDGPTQTQMAVRCSAWLDHETIIYPLPKSWESRRQLYRQMRPIAPWVRIRYFPRRADLLEDAPLS